MCTTKSTSNSLLRVLLLLQQQLEREYHNLDLWCYVAFILGIIYFLGNSDINTNTCYLLSITTIAIFALFLYKRNVATIFLLICVLMFLFGMAVTAIRVNSSLVMPIKQQMFLTITADVTGLKPTLRGDEVILENIQSEHSLNKVRINISKKLIGDIAIGDRIQLKTRLFPLSGRILPGTYNFGFYLYVDGIEATGYALSKPQIINKNIKRFVRIVQSLRNQIYKHLIEVMGDTNGNFAAAILIGETKAIPKTVAQNMRITGIAHILSVSGLHLSLVAMVFFIASRTILNCFSYIADRCNVKVIAASISMVGSFMYLLISGSNISAIRAFIMTLIMIIAVMAGRARYAMRSVVIAAFLILIFLPEYILHPSFQLSFTAVLSLVAGYELYAKHRYLLGSSKGLMATIKMYLVTNIYSSLIASIVTAPYVVYHFYTFANYSMIMNLIAIPIMSFFMMPLGLIALILMPFGYDFFILKLLGWFISIVVSSADFIGNLPGSVWYIGNISGISLLSFTLGFFWLIFWSTKWRYYGLGVIAIAFLLMMNQEKPDLIYDHYFKAVGVKNQLGQLEVYSQKKIPKFTLDYWANWFGQKELKLHYAHIEHADVIFQMTDDKQVSLNYSRCTDASLMIITSDKLKCVTSKGLLINYDQFNQHKTRTLLAFCSSNNNCHIQLE